jgi:hypothetical protein
MEDVVFVIVFYFLFAFSLIYPPNEIVSLGFSIPTLFSTILGSEDLYFVFHHIARISLTACIHSFLPLGSFFGFNSMCLIFNSFQSFFF